MLQIIQGLSQKLSIFHDIQSIEAKLLRLMWQYIWTIGQKRSFEQRANIKFCLKLGKTAAKTHQMMQKVYGDKCLYRSTICELFKRFKEGRQDLNDDERSSRPSSSVN